MHQVALVNIADQLYCYANDNAAAIGFLKQTCRLGDKFVFL